MTPEMKLMTDEALREANIELEGVEPPKLTKETPRLKPGTARLDMMKASSPSHTASKKDSGHVLTRARNGRVEKRSNLRAATIPAASNSRPIIASKSTSMTNMSKPICAYFTSKGKQAT